MTKPRGQGKRKTFVLCAASLLLSGTLLTGCEVTNFQIATTAITAATQGLFSDPKVNLREKNYAAADYLLQQSGNYLNRTGVIEARALTEADNPAAVSALGRRMTDDIGQRFAELGYTVNLRYVSSKVDSTLYPPGAQEAPQFILSGSYLKKDKKLEVYLRIFEPGTQRVVSSFNYTMPYSSEIRRLAEADTQIIRLEGPQ